MLRMRVIRVGAPPQIMTFGKDVAVVGRAPDCDIVIDDPEVSRRHARILRGTVILDLGSRNGTWVDDQRVSEPTLTDGRKLRLGQGERAVEIHWESATPSAPAPVDDEMGMATLVSAAAGNGAAAPPPSAASASSPAAGAASGPVDAALRRELEEERLRSGKLTRALEELKRESETKKTSGASELAEARLEILRLNQRIQGLKSEQDARGKEGAESVQSKLLQERLDAMEQQNAALRKHVVELEGQAKNAAANAPPVPMSEFVARMQRELGRLQQENAALKAAKPAGAPVAPAPAPIPAPAAAPRAPQSALLPSLVESDLDKVEPPFAGDLDGFLLFVSVRFLRAVERLVTYTAREFVEVLEMRTMLPDADANFRGRLADLLAAPQDVNMRRALDDYLKGLSRWLVAGLAAHKKAAKEFALGVKGALTEEALTASSPIPAIKKLAGQREAELWKRTVQYMNSLTKDTVDDRIEKLARDAAQQMLSSNDLGGA